MEKSFISYLVEKGKIHKHGLLNVRVEKGVIIAEYKRSHIFPNTREEKIRCVGLAKQYVNETLGFKGGEINLFNAHYNRNGSSVILIKVYSEKIFNRLKEKIDEKDVEILSFSDGVGTIELHIYSVAQAVFNNFGDGNMEDYFNL